MKEVCGFIDTRGIFHKTKEECEIADIKIRVENTQRALNNFENRVLQYLVRNYSTPVIEEYQSYKNELFKVVVKMVLKQSDEFITIIKEKEKLAEDLEILEASYKNLIFKPWWLRIKWWK